MTTPANNPRNNLDEQIRKRRALLPWGIINLPRFIQDVVGAAIVNGLKPMGEVYLELKILARPDIDSGFVYELSWLGADGTQQSVRAANWELLLFRAAEVELQARAEQTQAITLPGAPIQRVQNSTAKRPAKR